jgi:hypothetical protein
MFDTGENWNNENRQPFPGTQYYFEEEKLICEKL